MTNQLIIPGMGFGLHQENFISNKQIQPRNTNPDQFSSCLNEIQPTRLATHKCFLRVIIETSVLEFIFMIWSSKQAIGHLYDLIGQLLLSGWDPIPRSIRQWNSSSNDLIYAISLDAIQKTTFESHGYAPLLASFGIPLGTKSMGLTLLFSSLLLKYFPFLICLALLPPRGSLQPDNDSTTLGRLSYWFRDYWHIRSAWFSA